MHKRKHTASEKFAIIQEIESGRIGVKDATKKFGITKTTLAKWRRRFRVFGYEWLEARVHYHSYSAEVKLQAIKEH